MTTTNYTFPCDTVNGLTLTQKREAVKALKAAIKEEATMRRLSKEFAKAEKAKAAEARREVAIAKAQAKLQRLLDKANPVGAKALKANRKPSACTVTTMAA
jgi:hypothetical protein